MTYSYQCSDGHRSEVQFRIGEQAAQVACHQCEKLADRDFGSDFSGVTFGVVDPFRSYDLSSKKIRAEGEQQRIIDAPRDSYERKILEKAYGRTYVGDDTSGMTQNARDGIEAYKHKKKIGDVR